MKRYLIFMSFLFILLQSDTNSIAYAKVVIIGNNNLSIKAITNKQIKDVFLGVESSFGGDVVIVADCKPLLEEFLAKFIGKSKTAYKRHWIKKVFSEGVNPPALLKTTHEVIAFVKDNKNAIGYIDKLPEDKSVTVLLE